MRRFSKQNEEVNVIQVNFTKLKKTFPEEKELI